MSAAHTAFAEARVADHSSTARSIERRFPLAEISLLAERESWRKEIFRPIYHIHKWWANRLGSVFRAIVLGAIGDGERDIWTGFYEKHNFSDKIVLDPFMGSGTTLGEAAKLGAKPIGCDINPISTFAVTQALTRVDIGELKRIFLAIESDVKKEISSYYTTLDPETGEQIAVLYYFWVKIVETSTGEVIPLFSSYIFSKNAYPQKKPAAKILCPQCWRINNGRYDAETLTCAHCHQPFNPQQGPVQGRYVTDKSGHTFAVKDVLPTNGRPPQHRLYALLALRANGEKIYLVPQAWDFTLLERAKEALQRLSLPLPTMPLRPGHNTNQARNYHYLYWRDFFNDRQLLCLGILLQRILQIPDQAMHDQFLCLFSTTLEFNNLFCSFKGEGTGAVRPLFSHHILKPERNVLENNVWGTPQSSGSFSRLFATKLLKAKQYLDEPFELSLDAEEENPKIVSSHIIASAPLNIRVTSSWQEFSTQPGCALVLNGDSAKLPIPDKVVDAVVTDPPYFDFIHYSELSDFFFAWLAPVLTKDYPFFTRLSSHHEGEVQNEQPAVFATNLTRVFRESCRVLKDDGLLVFSFHHSRPDGWAAIYQALRDSGFHVTAAYPVYAEMKGASPKSATKEPISVDVILVCKKSAFASRLQEEADASQKLKRVGIKLSKTDQFNIRAGLLLITASFSAMEPCQLKETLNRLKETTLLHIVS